MKWEALNVDDQVFVAEMVDPVDDGPDVLNVTQYKVTRRTANYFTLLSSTGRTQRKGHINSDRHFIDSLQATPKLAVDYLVTRMMHDQSRRLEAYDRGQDRLNYVMKCVGEWRSRS
jgi:hypothetical protein